MILIPQPQLSAINASECIGNGWNLIKQNYGLYLGIALIAMILAGCIPCVSIFLVGPIMGGVFFVLLRNMRGEAVDFGMMFKGFEKFVPLMVIGIVQSIPEIIGQVLRFTVDIGRLGLESGGRNSDFQYYQASDAAPFAIASGLLIVIAIVAFIFIIVGVAWRVLLFFAIPLALEHNLGPVDAMKLSARAAMSNVGGLVLLFILEIGVALIGILMLCIGLFFVMPIIHAANAFAYRQVFPMMGQTFQTAPPPPNMYGDFGRGQ